MTCRIPSTHLPPLTISSSPAQMCMTRYVCCQHLLRCPVQARPLHFCCRSLCHSPAVPALASLCTASTALHHNSSPATTPLCTSRICHSHPHPLEALQQPHRGCQCQKPCQRFPFFRLDSQRWILRRPFAQSDSLSVCVCFSWLIACQPGMQSCVRGGRAVNFLASLSAVPLPWGTSPSV